MKIKDIFIALLVPVMLGFGYAIAKPAMEYFPPFLLTGIRFTIPALMLVWWFPVPKGLLLDIFKISFIGSTLQYGMSYYGLNMVDASAAVLIVQLEVPFGIIIAYFLLKEVPSIKNLIALAISFIGVIILSGAPNLDGKYLAIFLLLSGAFTWSLAQVMAKPLSNKISAIALMTWLCVFSGPMLLLASVIFDGNPVKYFLAADLASLLTLGFLGFIMHPISYVAWYYVLRRYEVNKVMPVYLLLPVVGFVTAIILLGEQPSPKVYLGGSIIIFGVSLILFKNSKKKE